MSDYVLSCCSTADLTEEHFLRREISYVGFHYELGGVRYLDDLGKTIDFPTFYQAMEDGARTKTSPVSVDEFETYFEKLFFNSIKIFYFFILIFNFAKFIKLL